MRPYFDKRNKVNENITEVETVEEFKARGGKIQKVREGASGKKKNSITASKSKKVDAQRLLDAAVDTSRENEVVSFLRSQGIEVN